KIVLAWCHALTLAETATACEPHQRSFRTLPNVHRNGCYDENMYLNQVLQDEWLLPQFEKVSHRAVAAKEPIFLDTERFEYFTRSDIGSCISCTPRFRRITSAMLVHITMSKKASDRVAPHSERQA